MKGRTWLVALVVAAAFLTGQTFAQDRPATKPADKPAAAKPIEKAPAKSESAPAGADKAAMMAEFAKQAEPGPQHKALQPLIGNWTCDVKFWMEPGTPPDASSGTIIRKWILGDRYLSEDYEGTAGGMPFKGHGILGFDKGQNRYESIWIDTLSTGFMRQTGKADASSRIITFEGENFCPIENKMKWGKSVLEITSNDKNTLKMFMHGPDGKEFQSFDMVCTRK